MCRTLQDTYVVVVEYFAWVGRIPSLPGYSMRLSPNHCWIVRTARGIESAGVN